jgi:adenylate cyclase
LVLSEDLDLEKNMSELRRRREEILEHQRGEYAADPDLQGAYKRAFLHYQREVAKVAVMCALRIQDAVAAQTLQGAFLDLKIGMASGNVGIGNFGASEQIGYTVLGTTVNLAARLEPAASQNGCRFFLDATTYALLQDDADLMFRPWGKIRAKGINRDLTVYEPFQRDEALIPFLEAYAHGKQALENGDQETAIREFIRANELRPGGDPASQLHLKRLGSYQEHQTVLA